MITQNLKQTQNNIAEAAKKSGRTSDDILLVAVSKTKPLSALQEAYNKEHGITPTTIKKAVRDLISISKEVAKTEGILIGISSGAAIQAAKELAKREENKGKTIVVLLPDGGDRYLSTPLIQD